jgi:hypothetical protein
MLGTEIFSIICWCCTRHQLPGRKIGNEKKFKGLRLGVVFVVVFAVSMLAILPAMLPASCALSLSVWSRTFLERRCAFLSVSSGRARKE